MKTKKKLSQAHKILKRFLRTCLIAGGLSVSLSTAAQPEVIVLEPRLSLYAGPQSAAPTDSIHVTIEAQDADGHNIDGETLTLVYTKGEKKHFMNGIAVDGLASFEVMAQRRAGHMTFYARYAGYETEKGLVLITAGPAKALKIYARRGDIAGTVNIHSRVLKDGFDNPITDLSLVTLDWVDVNGLKARHNTRLSNGAVNFVMSCPSRYTGSLYLQASLGNLQFTTADLSRFCSLNEALES